MQGYKSTPVSTGFLWNYHDANEESQECYMLHTSSLAWKNLLLQKAKAGLQGYKSTLVSNGPLWNYCDTDGESQEI